MYCLSNTEPKALVLSEAFVPLLEQMRGGWPASLSVIRLDATDVVGTGRDRSDVLFQHLMAGGDHTDPGVVVSGSDIHNILYTSGTTGFPKGAMISQRAAALRGLGIAQWFRLTDADGYVGWLPSYHVAGDESLYATVLTGGRFAVLPSSQPEAMFQMIEHHRLSWTILVPGVVQAFSRHPARSRYDLTSLRFAAGYGDLLSKEVLREFTNNIGVPYYDAYGQTETSYLVAWYNTPPGTLPTLRKHPTPLMNVRLVDDEMRDMPDGQVGELVVQGPTMMSGYWRDPDATREVFRGGWLHTGDLLVRNPDGTLTFTDRKKSLIKTGGENVYPAEVERVVSQLPGVEEVCVVGLPDEQWGEAVHAVIVVRAGQQVTREDVEAACLKHLARYKRPRGVTFLASEEIPRSTTGKIRREALLAHILGEADRVDE